MCFPNNKPCSHIIDEQYTECVDCKYREQCEKSDCDYTSPSDRLFLALFFGVLCVLSGISVYLNPEKILLMDLPAYLISMVKQFHTQFPILFYIAVVLELLGLIFWISFFVLRFILRRKRRERLKTINW